MFFLLILLALFTTLIYLSIFEWMLHRFIMHRPFPGFTYPFTTHALTHHRIFRADKSYHLLKLPDKKTIPMAWWCGPVLVLITTSPSLPISYYFGAWWITGLVFVVSVLYFTAYEYMHWCMHLPRERFVERSGIFFRLNGHHLLHHRWMTVNFNVVFPLADFLFGTLLLRAKLRFDQAEGPSVPDVQPAEV